MGMKLCISWLEHSIINRKMWLTKVPLFLPFVLDIFFNCRVLSTLFTVASGPLFLKLSTGKYVHGKLSKLSPFGKASEGLFRTANLSPFFLTLI